MELLREIEDLLERIPSDFGGGSPLEKCYLMSHLAAVHRVSAYVEIGVYRGRSYFPLALTMQRQGGIAYGIDPYTAENARESDVSSELKRCIDAFIQRTDFDQLHRQVEELIGELRLQDAAQLLRMTSEKAAGVLRERGVSVGMLHVDGNHDTRFVLQDLELYLPMVKPGGIVILDDINWDSVKPAYEHARRRMAVLHETPEFAIFMNREDGPDLRQLKQELFVLYEALAARSARQRAAAAAPQGGANDAASAFEPHVAEAIRQSLQRAARFAQAAPMPAGPPKVSVSFVTYNQERHVATAIESILVQAVDFPYEIVISDDCSTDGTAAICREYERQYPERIRFVQRGANLGAVRNYLETFKSCRGAYVAFLEGDDFWIDPRKLQTQVDFLETHPDFAICCHNVVAVDEQGAPRRLLLHGVPEESTVEDLCRGPDYISTPSCMVRNHLLDEIPSWVYDLRGCDWTLDILHAEKGRIRFFVEPMAAYRVHQGGIWAGQSEIEKLQYALTLVQTMNREMGYRHARAFQVYEQRVRQEIRHHQAQQQNGAAMPAGVFSVAQSAGVAADYALAQEYETAMHELEKLRSLSERRKHELRALKRQHQDLRRDFKRARRTIASAEAWQRRSWLTRALHRWRPGAAPDKERSPEQKTGKGTRHPKEPPHPQDGRKLDLVVLDDVFPHPLSAFRFEEFRSYLNAIPDMKILSTGSSFPCFRETRSLEEVIHEAVAAHPILAGRVARYEPDVPLHATLAYFDFLGNARSFLRKIESENIPFAFTLYPGGYFELNSTECDAVLRRVFGSPCFRKVIATQGITREYLLEKKFCDPDQIEYISGIVTPQEHLRRDLTSRKRYGRDKRTLDICFVAHKYTPTGADKGYDVFVEVATRLAAAHPEVAFHVVGGFDESVLDVTALQGRIQFYGMQPPEWFESFYRDKDIIVSPNLPFQIGGGSFDGFPTGCCTDAALHGVAMFCTDILGLNEKFTDGRDIVILPHHVERITETIRHYLQHPEALAALAGLGCATAREVYSFENQMAPRLRLLQAILQDESHALPLSQRRQNV